MTTFAKSLSLALAALLLCGGAAALAADPPSTAEVLTKQALVDGQKSGDSQAKK